MKSAADFFFLLQFFFLSCEKHLLDDLKDNDFLRLLSFIYTTTGAAAVTCWVSLSDVDHQKVCYVAEILDELLELIKFVHKRGSGAAPETQHQWSVVWRRKKN